MPPSGRLCAIAGSFEAACTILVDWGINISLKRIERLTYKFGKIGINLYLSKILNYHLGNLPTGNILKYQRVVIAVELKFGLIKKVIRIQKLTDAALRENGLSQNSLQFISWMKRVKKLKPMIFLLGTSRK